MLKKRERRRKRQAREKSSDKEKNGPREIRGGRGDVVVANSASPQSILHCSKRENILFAIFV